MANGCASAVFRQVVRVFQEGTLAGLLDGEVLERFVERRDEAAFELLLRRHGSMVRNVCRQTLFDPHEVEDAFQATFLALICKASSLRVEGSVGPWLYRVASRISARARANRRRRSEHEVPIASLPEPTSRDDPDRGEIPRVVHEELGRLPERLRAPLILCYLEGMTHELAARQLRLSRRDGPEPAGPGPGSASKTDHAPRARDLGRNDGRPAAIDVPGGCAAGTDRTVHDQGRGTIRHRNPRRSGAEWVRPLQSPLYWKES